MVATCNPVGKRCGVIGREGDALSSESANDTDDWDSLPRCERLKRSWSGRQYRRFWAIVNDELLPELIRTNVAKFRCSALSREDIEDCCQEALWPFVNGKAEHVADPEPYIRRSVRNACIEQIRSYKRRRRAQEVLETEFIRESGLRPGRTHGSSD